MKKIVIALGWALVVVQGSVAAEAIVGDAAAGKAKTLICSACHGDDGNSAAAAFPKLAGQNEKYLLKQMNDIRRGARPVPTMAGQLDNMSDEDLADMAAYYASHTNWGGRADETRVALGRKVYRAGVSASGVAACTACHGARGAGNGPAGFPALAGQYAGYTADQLRKFRTGAENTLAENANGRTNDGDTRMMRDVAARMSDREIDAVSSYIAGLH